MATMTVENPGFPGLQEIHFYFVFIIWTFIPREMAEGDLQFHSEDVKSEMILSSKTVGEGTMEIKFLGF